jgi:hypothetical protein
MFLDGWTRTFLTGLRCEPVYSATSRATYSSSPASGGVEEAEAEAEAEAGVRGGCEVGVNSMRGEADCGRTA